MSSILPAVMLTPTSSSNQFIDRGCPILGLVRHHTTFGVEHPRIRKGRLINKYGDNIVSLLPESGKRWGLPQMGQFPYVVFSFSHTKGMVASTFTQLYLLPFRDRMGPDHLLTFTRSRKKYKKIIIIIIIIIINICQSLLANMGPGNKILRLTLWGHKYGPNKN